MSRYKERDGQPSSGTESGALGPQRQEQIGSAGPQGKENHLVLPEEQNALGQTVNVRRSPRYLWTPFTRERGFGFGGERSPAGVEIPQSSDIPDSVLKEAVREARHKGIRRKFESETLLGSWGELVDLFGPAIGEKVNVILDAHILPVGHPTGKVPLLVSLSANAGQYEQAFAKRLSDRKNPFRVIAGDIADVQRVPGQATPMRFDASCLPFPPGRISAMFDNLGALWYEAMADLESSDNPSHPQYPTYSRGENTLTMFAHLRDKLHAGGVLITDAEVAFFNSTGYLVDIALGKGQKVPGFTTSTIGEGAYRMRVYTKI